MKIFKIPPKRRLLVFSVAVTVALAVFWQLFNELQGPSRSAAPEPPRGKNEAPAPALELARSMTPPPESVPPVPGTAPTAAPAAAPTAAPAAGQAGEPGQTAPGAALPPAGPGTAPPADIFAVRTWEPPPPPPAAALPPPPPQAPPLPFRFIGRIAEPGKKPAFLLAHNEGVLMVSVGDVIDGVWRLEKFSGGELKFRYRPLKLLRTLPIGDGGTP